MEPLDTCDLLRECLVSFMLLPSPLWNSIKEKTRTLLNHKSRFAGFNLLVFAPSRLSVRRPLSYEVSKRSNNGGENPHRLEVFDECGTEGWGSVEWDRREGDESLKVQDTRSSLRVALEDCFERMDDSSSRQRSSVGLAEELFGTPLQ